LSTWKGKCCRPIRATPSVCCYCWWWWWFRAWRTI